MIANRHIFVVEDDADLAFVWQRLLAASGTVRVFHDAETFLAEPKRRLAACLVVDLNLPGLSGLDLLQRLGSDDFCVPTIVVSGEATVAATITAFECGAFRVFEKPVAPRALLDAVREAISRNEERTRAAADRARRFGNLTQRERQVLDMLLEDKAIKQIARELGISASTVEKHRAKILLKAGVSSVVGLARSYLLAGELAPSVMAWR